MQLKPSILGLASEPLDNPYSFVRRIAPCSQWLVQIPI